MNYSNPLIRFLSDTLIYRVGIVSEEEFGGRTICSVHNYWGGKHHGGYGALLLDDKLDALGWGALSRRKGNGVCCGFPLEFLPEPFLDVPNREPLTTEDGLSVLLLNPEWIGPERSRNGRGVCGARPNFWIGISNSSFS